MTSVYLTDVGFRAPGVRLVAPVRTADGAHTLMLGELIATPEGTDLTYYLTGLVGDEGYTPRQDVVAIRSAAVEHVLAPGAFSFGSDRQRLRRRISSTSVIPQWTGPVEIAITVSGVGEFRLGAELRAFGPATDAPRRDVNASATHEGITVTVRGVGAAREETAVEIEVAVGAGECCVGIGGYQGNRLGPTALSIRDETGRVYAERWREPGRLDHATLALFQPLHPDARQLELVVPYIYVEEPATMEAVPLPVTTPTEARLGNYGIRVLGTARIEANPRARDISSRESAIRVDLDLGGWHGDRRVMLPGRLLVDGDFCNIGWRLPGMMNATLPEPVDRVEITGERALSAKTLGFSHPSIQVRGPWRIPLSADEATTPR